MSSNPFHVSGSDIEIDANTQATLDCLREAVADALERKRRLGQYYAQWTPAGIQLVGPDAPLLKDNELN